MHGNKFAYNKHKPQKAQQKNIYVQDNPGSWSHNHSKPLTTQQILFPMNWLQATIDNFFQFIMIHSNKNKVSKQMHQNPDIFYIYHKIQASV